MSIPFVVCSFGGCGSKFLVKQIARYLELPAPSAFHSHTRWPERAKFASATKIIFIFGDPLAAIHSFFSRRQHNTTQHGFDGRVGEGSLCWARDHCRNIGGRAEKLDTAWNLENYIANGEDLFLLEEFVDNWLTFSRKEGVLFLRYETMWDKLIDVSDYLGFDDAFSKEFQAKIPRSSLLQLDDEAAIRLKELYADVSAKLEALPGVSVRY